jgi:hypothetical protein
MANSSESGEGGAAGSDESRRQLKQDRVIENVVPDPRQPPSVITLTGLLGNGAEEGSWRLYLSADLREYVDFAESDIVHHEPISQEQFSLGGTTVWLKAEAKLRHTSTTSRQVQADFLQGGISSNFMPSANPWASSGWGKNTGGPWVCTHNYACSLNPHIPACRNNTGALQCGGGAVTGILCASYDCTVVLCPSQGCPPE